MQFVVIKFSEDKGYAVVSDTWLEETPEECKCYFPSGSDIKKTKKGKDVKDLASIHHDPTGWKKYKCTVHERYDTYLEADEELIRLLNVAITETESDSGNLQRCAGDKQLRKNPPRNTLFDSEDTDDGATVPTKSRKSKSEKTELHRVPTPPAPPHASHNPASNSQLHEPSKSDRRPLQEKNSTDHRRSSNPQDSGKKSNEPNRGSTGSQNRDARRSRSRDGANRSGSREKADRHRSESREKANRNRDGSRDKAKLNRSRSRDKANRNRDGIRDKDNRHPSQSRNKANRSRSRDKANRSRSRDKANRSRSRDKANRSRSRDKANRNRSRSRDNADRHHGGSRDKTTRSRSRDKANRNRSRSRDKADRSRSRDKANRNRGGSRDKANRSRSRDKANFSRGRVEANRNSSQGRDKARASGSRAEANRSWSGIHDDAYRSSSCVTSSPKRDACRNRIFNRSLSSVPQYSPRHADQRNIFNRSRSHSFRQQRSFSADSDILALESNIDERQLHRTGLQRNRENPTPIVPATAELKYLSDTRMYRMAVIRGLASIKTLLTKRLSAPQIQDEQKLEQLSQRFPLTTPEELESENKQLESNTADLTELIKYLSLYGGDDPGSATRSALRRLMSDELQSLFSWEGQKGKQKLNGLTYILKAIYRAVRVHYPNVPEKTIKGFICGDLRNAKQRLDTNSDARNGKVHTSGDGGSGRRKRLSFADASDTVPEPKRTGTNDGDILVANSPPPDQVDETAVERNRSPTAALRNDGNMCETKRSPTADPANVGGSVRATTDRSPPIPDKMGTSASQTKLPFNECVMTLVGVLESILNAVVELTKQVSLNTQSQKGTTKALNNLF